MRLEAKIIEINTKDIIKGINQMSEKDRVMVIEGITRMNTVERQKWSLVTSSRLLLKENLSVDQLFTLLSICNMLKRKIEKRIKKSG